MKTKLAAIFLAAISVSAAHAAPSAPELAKESMDFIERHELFLQGAINDGRKDKYYRFVWQPALAQSQKWPVGGDVSYGKYGGCQQAVIAFLAYSEAQFKTRGALAKSDGDYRRFAETKKECAIVLQGARK